MLAKSSRSTGSAAAAAAAVVAGADLGCCWDEDVDETGVTTAAGREVAAVAEVEIGFGRDGAAAAGGVAAAGPVPPKSIAAIFCFSARCAAATESCGGGACSSGVCVKARQPFLVMCCCRCLYNKKQ